MNAVAIIPHNSGRSLSAADLREHVNLIQEVMQAVMRKDTHYGVIPGCKQPSLYKAGSEVLLTTFRIAVSVHVEDLSTDDCIHYRVRTVGTHQGSGVVVGEGIGECSSNEEKYKWRKCFNKKEFEATPESRRRIKFGKYGEDMQVRTEPADVANTILKMGKKRAQIDLTLTATAASDIFTQDVEDLPEELRERHEMSSAGNAAVQQTIKEGPERDAADKEAGEVAAMGVEKFRAMWSAWPKDKRLLVADLMPKYQKAAEAADAEVSE
jgi:hypothetical protein